VHAFRVLRQLVCNWLADAAERGNAHADALLQQLYRWLSSPHSALRDPALLRLVRIAMRRLFKALLGELRIGVARGLFEESLALAFHRPLDQVHRAAALTHDPGELALLAKSDRLGTNGGTAAGLVGTYAQVAERMKRFHEAGIETFMLQYQPFEAEMRRFAAEVMPLVKR
jgi:alkanesulfonate monooxygenase SsuD/methylene tetrahydromethanopterin reductase-like flavin-dependent oxidoreductase (luciferase family)